MVNVCLAATETHVTNYNVVCVNTECLTCYANTIARGCLTCNCEVRSLNDKRTLKTDNT